MLCKSLNMCVTNEHNLWLLLTSFCDKSIVLQCNISAFTADILIRDLNSILIRDLNSILISDLNLAKPKPNKPN